MLTVVLGIVLAVCAVLLGAWATYGTLIAAAGPRELAYVRRVCLAGWGAVLVFVGAVVCCLQHTPQRAMLMLAAGVLVAPFAVYRVSWRRQLIRVAEQSRDERI